MCPRKSAEGKVAKWAYDMYKRQTRKLVHGPFLCPSCAKNLLTLKIDRKKKEVTATCVCGINAILDFFPSYEPIDYYNRFTDEMRK